jgi:hypothetical protein
MKNTFYLNASGIVVFRKINGEVEYGTHPALTHPARVGLMSNKTSSKNESKKFVTGPDSGAYSKLNS